MLLMKHNSSFGSPKNYLDRIKPIRNPRKGGIMNKRTNRSMVTFVHWVAFGVVAAAEMAREFSFI